VARRRRRSPFLLLAIALVALAISRYSSHNDTSPASASPGTSRANPSDATVVRVIDGDTVELDLGGRHEHARLIGVDTPETVDQNRPVQCYGHEASALTSALLPPGTAVHVSRDVEARDRYGRLLVYLERASDGLLVNVELARQGAGVPLRIAPNVALADTIAIVTAEAKTAGRGLWGACGGPGLPASATTSTVALPK
jgi:micrococcal nuclease